MRITYLHQYFKRPTESGGTRSYDLAYSFVKEGHEVDMVTTTDSSVGFDGKKWKLEMVDGIRVHYLHLPYDNSFSFIKRAWVFFLFLWYSSMKLLAIKADLVLATSTPLTIGIPALIKKTFHRTPYIFEVRDVWPEAVVAIGAIKNKAMVKMLYKLEYIIYKGAKFIVPLSTDMQKSIVDRFPEFTEKAQCVIPNISEVDRFLVKDIDQEEKSRFFTDLIGSVPDFSVLYAGTFGKVNNIDYLIALAKQVQTINPNIVFLLLGGGSEKPRLELLAKEMGILNVNLFFLASIPKQELPKLYNHVSMGSSFVAPIKALWANSANKFFDTLAAGKPILINHGGWQADVIQQHKIGYVLNHELNAADVENFISYLSNEDQLKISGSKAREVAKDNYALQIASQNYFHLINTIAKEQKILK